MFFLPKRITNDTTLETANTEKAMYYSSEAIRRYNAMYYIVFGKRGNGKSYDAGYHMIEDYWNGIKEGKLIQSAYVRRWATDIANFRSEDSFASLLHDDNGRNRIEELTDGMYDDIIYKKRKWFLTKTDDDGNVVTAPTPFAFAYALNEVEHDKNTNKPHCQTIYFDEFIPMAGDNRGHLVGEFSLFKNMVSSLKRNKGIEDGFKVFLLGNSINPEDIYFENFGLYHVREQEIGTIECYKFGRSGLSIAVEYCSPTVDSEGNVKTDPFFAFDDPSLSMITTGAWDLDFYPLIPFSYDFKDVKGRFFVIHNNTLLECNIVKKNNSYLICVDERLMPINDDKELIYCAKRDPRPNWRTSFNKAFSEPEQKILQLIQMDKIFFSTNKIGNIFDNFLSTTK